MALIVLAIYLLATYVCVNVGLTLLEHRRAHQFFKTKTPNLPVLPKPNIVWGHILQVAARRKNYRIVSELHKKYGPTFGYYHAERPWVSTTDLELIKRVELDEAHKHINRDDCGIPFSDFNHSIFMGTPESWKRTRRAIGPALSNLRIRGPDVQGDIQSILKQFEEGIEARMPKASRAEQEPDPNNNDSGIFEPLEEQSIILDLDDHCQRFTLAVIFLITYKKENTINFKTEKDEWVEKMHESARLMSNPLILLSICFPWLRSTIENIITYLHPVGRMRSKINEYILKAADLGRAARIQAHKLALLRGSKTGPDEELSARTPQRMIDTMIDAMLDKKITYDDFVGSALFMLLAGFQTTADAMTCLLWHLARNADIQEKLRQSVLLDGLDSQYLHWCVMECVRYHPSVPLGTGRILGDDIEVSGTFLPKGTFVMPSTHTVQHDPKIWPQPQRFWPERWAKSADFHPAQFLGFGIGPRNCLGGRLAMQEIKQVAHLLVTKYRLETCDETPKEFKFGTPGLFYTVMDQPVKVRIVKTAV